MTTMFALSRQYGLKMCGMLAAGILTASALWAQTAQPRIQNEINVNETTVLRGSQHPVAALPQFDTGRLPAGNRMNGVTLYFSRTAAQQAAVDALIAAQQDPSSPQFHKWLTPEQFGARFGMAQADIDKVQAWLEREGFSIDSIMRSRTGIRFSGTVRQVENAFGTQMHTYTVGGEKHFAPSTALSVPTSVSGVVAGVRNLDDFRPKAQHVVARPNFTSGSSGNNYFAPGDIVTAYDINPLYTAGMDGTGQTIAIMGQSFVDVSDITRFQDAAGLTQKAPQMVLVPGSGNDGATFAGDEGESDLDLEWSSAMAPGADIVFVYTGDSSNSNGVYDSTQFAVDNRIGNIISLSYSSCETQFAGSNASYLTMFENMFSQAATQGQTVMAASGDQGSTACYGNSNLTTAQQEAIVVNYPASSAYVTGVGGTEAQASDFDGGSSSSTYWTSNGASDVLSSLKKRMPEIVWNDDPTSGCPAGQSCLGATGGGKSSLFAQPSWQKAYFTATGETNPDSSHRLVPDIAFYSSAGAPGYLYCTSDTAYWDQQDGQVASCDAGFRDNASGLLTVAGGTSFATPIFAGMMALINQSAGYVTGSGEVNQELYKLAQNSGTYASVFFDVTSGNNNCLTPTNCASTGSSSGYSAKAGYDMVTGLGSLDISKLAAVWPASTSVLVGAKVAVQPASASVAPSTNDVVTITVSAQTGSTIPTGKVDLLIDGGADLGGTTLADQTLNSSGQVTYTANFASSGVHQVAAQYKGDATFATATGVGTIAVTGGSGGGTIKLAASPSSLSVSRGSSGNETLTLTPSGGYKGTVGLSYSVSAGLENLCVFAGTGIDSNGNMTVTGTSAVSGTIEIDTNAANCASTNAVTGHGMRVLPRSHSGVAANQKPKGSVPAGLAFAGLLLAGLLGRSSRKLRGLACLIALAAVMFGVSACSSSSGGGGGPSNPAKGSYTIMFQGQDSVSASISSQTSFTLVIK